MIDSSLLAPPAPGPNVLSGAAFEAMAKRERVSDHYWAHTDTIPTERLWWRAQTVRHMFHILPGETVLELGCGTGAQTRAIYAATRGECPITAATFTSGGDLHALQDACPKVEIVELTGFPGELAGRQFDYVIGGNLLDQRQAAGLLREVQKLLQPGGRLLFFETNPWNPVFQIRKWLSGPLPFLRRGDERTLHNQVQLYELLSEVGYISISATCYDFLYPPIPRWLMMPARNLTLIMENTPGLRNLAGTVVLHAQKAPRPVTRPAVRMTEQEALHGAVSVVVPCYNEEMNVGPLVDGLLRHYDEYLHEIILVDDNSKDRTRQVIQSLAAADPRIRPVFRQPPNGVGRALADGMKAATGKYILLMDCDFLHILPELREMFAAAAAGNDVVLGSRFSRDSVLINYPLQKILCNRSFHILVNLLFHRRIRDLTNNLKLMRREVVENLDLEAAWFAVNAETGLKPLLMGYKVWGVPISWINRTPEMGQSSFSLLTNGLGYAGVLCALVWRTRLGFRQLPRRSQQRIPASDAQAHDSIAVRPTAPR